MHELFLVLFLVPLTNLSEKVLDFGVFLGFGKVVFLVEIFQVLLI
jgi:hypothetical protein